MLESLEQIDRDLFLVLNGLNSTFFDSIMTFLSGNVIWIPFYIVLLYVLFKRYEIKQFTILVAAIVLCVIVSDQTSVHFFKNVFERYRPCHNLEIMNLVHAPVGCGGLYGFVSSHAVNVFGIATFLGMILRGKVAITLIIWAVIVSYSRIYLGVHYPADILVGAFWGITIGALMYKAILKFVLND